MATYSVSKLAREISEYTKVKMSDVWDALDELGFHMCQLSKSDVRAWTFKVEKIIYG